MNDAATADLLILARALQFGAGMVLVTVAAFRAFVLRPGFATENDDALQALAPFLRRLWKIFLFALAAHLVSGLLLFWAVAAGMSGSSLGDALHRDTLSTVLFQTRFGAVCLWRAGFLVLLIFTVPIRPWTLRRRLSLVDIAAGLLAAALFVSIAWTGHAASSGGSAQPWNLVADALHLLAASIWPAGLFPFALFLSFAGRDPMAPHLVPVMKTTLRFSAVSFVTVFVLAATGTLNAFFLVGSFTALVTTNYGQVLCLKLLLFAGMLVIAAWNRWRLLPRLFDSGDAPPDARPVLRRLRNFVLAELSLAVAVIIVVALLGTLPPPR
jgi:putative copper resistance protein D